MNKKNNKIIAFMPLRKGSKGIKGKNTKFFLNKELFRWVLDEIVSIALFDEIWIATNDDIIKNIVNDSYNGEVNIYNRSEEAAQDTSPTIDVVVEFLSDHYQEEETTLVLFQATSPLTSSDDIKKFLNEIISKNAETAVACYRLKKFIWKENGKPLSYELKNKPRRQDYKGELIESGAIYSSKVSQILKNNQLTSDTCSVIEISDYAMIDLDEPIDWIIGETFAKTLISNERK